MTLNAELLRWIILIGAAPIWWPFLRMLWQDFNDTLAEEGGIFGQPPGPHELERLRAAKEKRPDPLINEPWAHADERGVRGFRAAEPRSPRPTPAARGGFTRKPGRGGFR